MRWTSLILLSFAVWGCDCGATLARRDCTTDPTLPHCQHPTVIADAGPVNPPADCTEGTVTGNVCAPDQHTSISGAEVSVSGTCNGQGYLVTTTTNANGDFSLSVPVGMQTVQVSSGSFSTSYNVTVVAHTTTAIPVNQLCFQSHSARLAVITGSGDKIETLLTSLNLTFTTYDGQAGFSAAGGGLSLLTSPTELAKYDVIFIDCAAGKNATSHKLDLGTSTTAVGDNLRQFVQAGGSLYASDWAFLYVHLAFPDFHWMTFDSQIVTPFDPYDLMGYAAQTITASVSDSGLRNYLNKSTVTITFPARSGHWGLMDSLSGMASPLLNGTSQKCSTNTCNAGGASVSDAPLAAMEHLTTGHGGVVIYTSFHNIGQQNPQDIEQILSYLIFKL